MRVLPASLFVLILFSTFFRVTSFDDEIAESRLSRLGCADVQMTIMQNLQYNEHLSEPMAELVTVYSKEFDNDILGEKVLG